MAMVNPQMMNPVAFNPNMKDSRWLTLEVCREYVRQKCSRTENECKFAHPPAHVEVQNGRVTCCFDSIKSKCQRKDPPCKYLHPPQHLKEQLLQNGRNNLILKNLQMQALAANMPPIVPGVYPSMAAHHPYVLQNPGFNPYINAQMGLPSGVVESGSVGVPVSSQSTVTGVVPNPSIHKMQRPDRLETTTNGTSDINSWATGSHLADNPVPSSQYSPIYFQGMNAMPGMVPMVKRQAVPDNKSGIPMYAPGAASPAYQQAALAMQLQQQQFVPVTMPLVANAQSAVGVATSGLVTNATSVTYFDESNQLLDTLPVCRDFKTGQCKRPQCKYVHLVEDYVEVCEGKVTVCRDAVKGKCTRPLCKYYHIPVLPQLLV